MNRYAAHGPTMAHPAGSYVRHADAMAAIAALEAENAKLRRALDDALDFIRGQSGQAAKYFKSARRIEGGE